MEENNKMHYGRGFGITSLVFSILSVLFLQFIVISVIFGILSIVFGWFSFKQKDNLGKAGLIIGIISICITFILFLLLNVFDISSLFMIPSWYK